MQDMRDEVCRGALPPPPPHLLAQGDGPPVQHLQQAVQRQALPHHAHQVQPRAGAEERGDAMPPLQQELPVQER